MKYRKKPVEVEAFEFFGNNAEELMRWIGPTVSCDSDFRGSIAHLRIHTLEGVMVASIGDFIIKGVQGEFYPCKPDIFWETYERAS